MKIFIRCGGVIRSGSERELIDEYLKRASGLVQNCGIHSIVEQQVDLRKFDSRAAGTRKLFEDISAGSQIIAMDERGKDLTSRKISQFIQSQSLDGCPALYFVIGGADGFDPEFIPNNARKWSLGSQTWPHKLLRAMLCEQMYRALSILSGSPYHRD
ncbi:MAG: 23S rRNA (pseudouridine(1915)-N(3))-methyltransferase RlmH [Hellea sp.]|nr:23S rRNA (pseudouridine(1915)-N(3))-methyltransferase RlmH [Hellea sp.]